MDSLQEAIIHPPELCEAHFIIDVHGLFDVFWTVEQKHPPTAMITSQITYVTMVPPREQDVASNAMGNAISDIQLWIICVISQNWWQDVKCRWRHNQDA